MCILLMELRCARCWKLFQDTVCISYTLLTAFPGTTQISNIVEIWTIVNREVEGYKIVCGYR